MAKKKPVKNDLNWKLFLILLISALVIGLIIITWSVTRPFCANSLSCTESLSLKIENGATGIFNGQVVVPPKVDLSEKEPMTQVLGAETPSSDKHIYVDLTTQTIKAFDGNSLVLDSFVATGKWHPTPTGEFKIWEKLRATRMSGGTGADFYDLPNVPFVMYFSGSGIPSSAGYGLHGAYWHDNFGHPMSHGCVNMRTVDAEKLFAWAEVGTKITIYGEAPL